MAYIRLQLLLCSLISFSAIIAQSIGIGVPITINQLDANAAGYYNQVNKTIVFGHQTGKSIVRSLYNADFALLKSYSIPVGDEYLAERGKEFRFYSEVPTSSRYFEIYKSFKKIQVWELDFDRGTDVLRFEMNIRDYYPDEIFVAALPFAERISLLTFSRKENKLLLHDVSLEGFVPVTTEFHFPKHSLTVAEAREWGKHLTVDFSKAFRGLYVSDLNQIRKFDISTGNQLFYNDTTLYFLFRLPYNAGFHLLELNRQSEEVVSKNFLLNKTVAGNINTSREKIPSITAADSLLVIMNNDYNNMDVYVYNIFSKDLLAKYSENIAAPSGKLIHSELKQAGTYGSRKAGKDIENTNAFFRKKNAGEAFLKAFVTGDSLVVTFGGFQFTPGIEGTLLTMYTGIPSSMIFSNPAGGIHLYPYLTTYRSKFLFGHSKFSLKTFKPAESATVTTPLNRIADDKKIDDLKKGSSFVIEMDGQIVLGIFNQDKRIYEISKY